MHRIKGLDSLRAIAVLLVIKAHWGPYSIQTVPVLNFIVKYVLPSGVFAVDFFFVLSGFLITTILLKSKESSLNPSKFHSLKTFIIRRSLRIFPIYFLYLLIHYLIDYPDLRKNVIYFATYTANYLCFDQKSFASISHTWSLSVEEQFYLFWPFLILFTKNRYLKTIIIAVIIFSTISAIITSHIYGPFAYLLTFNCFNAFAIGALYSLHRTLTPENKFSGPFWQGLVFISILLYVMQYFGIEIVPLRIVHAVISLAIIMRVTEQRYSKLESLILDNRLLDSLGKVSYGIYLFHYTIPYFYAKALDALSPNSHLHTFKIPLVAEFIQLMVVIIISYVSFYFLELPFLKIKERFGYSNSKSILYER